MFGKILSSVGIGAAKVDAKLDQATYAVGDVITGTVHIKGGKQTQNVEKAYVTLETYYEAERGDNTIRLNAELAKLPISDAFTIGSGDEFAIPFQMQIPLNTPITTRGHAKVWVQSGLDVKMALDPDDRDYLEIKAHPLMRAFFNAAKMIGFTLREVECEESPKASKLLGIPFVQEFEFKPTTGEFAGKLDELEAVFVLSETEATVYLQVDRKARGLRGLLEEELGMDESSVRISYRKEQLGDGFLANLLAETIRKYC